ncbi:MAG: class II aldolase/adducin family protein, partial [Gammaproteobacteria bacterium]
MRVAENKLRADLACAFRWAARLDLHEGVANHFSVAADESGARFLINPAGRHFSQICASELLLLNADETPPAGKNAPDPTAWCLHSFLHRNVSYARCILHSHAPFATALASLAEWRMSPTDQNSCRFYDRVSYDEHFGGMLLAEKEAARQARALDGKKVLVMRGHGVLTCAATVAEAFDLLYYFERACRNQHLAMSSGAPLFTVPPEIAAQTAQQWDEYPN